VSLARFAYLKFEGKASLQYALFKLFGVHRTENDSSAAGFGPKADTRQGYTQRLEMTLCCLSLEMLTFGWFGANVR
jgi:hypothetical protein